MEEPTQDQDPSAPKEPPRGIDWAKIKASAQNNVQKVIGPNRKVTAGQIAGAGAFAALLVVGAIWAWLFWGLPNVGNAESLWALNRQPGVTYVDLEGNVIGTRGPYYGHAVKIDELPPYVPQAFLAIEDQRFYEHGGVDRQAILRAAAQNILKMRTVQGGSTITQQLCKNLFLTPDRSVHRKLQEMILAGRVERVLSKDEILELYLNRVYLGAQAYGVDAAARRYFGKGAHDLTLAEAAMLGGLPKAPSSNAPNDNFDRAKARQHLVLQAMADAKFISQQQADAAWTEQVKIVPAGHIESVMGYVFDLAADQAKKLAGDKTPDMVVRVTVDPAFQMAASKAINADLPATKKGAPQLQSALVSIDTNGAIRALVGGRSYDDSKFNRATQAKRQPGSSFKTFVYATAFEEGLDPDTVRYDEPVTIGNWQPQNYEGTYMGAVSLRTAFALSINTVAAQVAHEVGERKVVALAHRFGITSDLPAVPSIALGSAEVTPLEMTQAYAAFMRDGRKTDPYIVQAVEDSRGNVVYNRPTYAAQRVYDPQLVHQMIGMMGHVVQHGTGMNARLGDREVAGKTGTSTDWRDAWFVGFTADYTTGVWVGYDGGEAMNHVSGAGVPSSIWRDYMTVASKGLPSKPLPGYDTAPRGQRDFQLATFYDALAEAFGFHRDSSDQSDDDVIQ